MAYIPGLKIFRRIGEEFYFHPHGRPDEKTVVRLLEATSQGAKISVITGGDPETEEMVSGDEIIFGEKTSEVVVKLDESVAGHGSFRILAHPGMVVRRIDTKGERS